MMDPVTVVCDRCGATVEGQESEGATIGFYRVRQATGELSGPWAKYARKREHVICNSCMWSDEKYQKDTGFVPI